MILIGLRTLLLAQSSITDLVTNDGGRKVGVYIEKAPQGAALRYVILADIDEDPYAALDGTTGLKATEIDIDSKGATYDQAMALAEAVDAFFKDYSGAAGDQTIAAVVKQNRLTQWEPLEDGSENGRFVVTDSYLVQWS